MPLLLAAAILTFLGTATSLPAEPFNFTQRVDHFSENVATFQQRDYQNAS